MSSLSHTSLYVQHLGDGARRNVVLNFDTQRVLVTWAGFIPRERMMVGISRSSTIPLFSLVCQTNVAQINQHVTHHLDTQYMCIDTDATPIGWLCSPLPCLTCSSTTARARTSISNRPKASLILRLMVSSCSNVGGILLNYPICRTNGKY